MMSHHTPTPAPTPIKDSATHHSKKLPLIVDIAIDNNGKQLYQVHESSKSVRREMPRSTNFSNTGIHIDDGSIFVKQEEKTPIRRVLGTLSPSTLNQKKGSEDEYDEPELATRKDSSGDYTSADEAGPNLFSNFDQDDFSQQPINSGYSRQLPAAKGTSDNDIWSEDVEQAFEEVLSIIPKNGLNKIKISGRSCGRNELISDYIYTKTGKFRTRKQVSSHIQVIKNLGQKLDIIRLINEGPSFENEEAQAECNKKFEEIFSKINMNKSLGLNDNVPVTGLKRKSTPSYVPNSNSQLAAKRIRRKPSKANPFSSLQISFQGFFMSIDDSFSSTPNPFILTVQDSNHEVKKLVIKENANITSRFPGLDDFQNCNNIPIIHNMVKIHFTNFTQNYSVDDGLRSNFSLRWDDLEESSRQYSSFTCIYSFGKEVLKFTEEGFKFNENRTFLVKFWKFFLSKLVGKEEKEANLAFKGMTIKQIIFQNENIDLDPAEALEPTNVVPKSKIKLVLLWEFAKVMDFKDAATTTSKLILPSKILASNENIVPQMVDYPQGPSVFPDSTAITAATISATPNMPYQTQSTYLGTSQLNHEAVQAVPVMQTPGSVETSWAKPQVSAQMKFQNLQQAHLQPTQLSPQQQRLQQQQFTQFTFQTPVSSMLPQQPFASHQVLNQVSQQSQQQVAGQQSLMNSNIQFQVQGNHGAANIDLGMIPTTVAPESHDYSLQPAYSEGYYQ
ncbi:TEA/ATTS transcription factor [Scheffersomyces xylosifermentans]|uniref:TEA/ATTS transcription factor n=1 Tax=Scheffersomyces xylosifermentans TaxID=1304137 RepID=UPI00315D5305